jgi:hypothetical protein
MAGMPSTPTGWVWHHAEDGIDGANSTTMQLIPADIHQATAHTGTAAYARAIGGLAADIVTDPTTYMSAGVGAFLSAMAPSPANAGEDEILKRLNSEAGPVNPRPANPPTGLGK